ncbi:MAG: nitrous oxide-stimulated promoter family protein [Desulfobulbus sp.]|nr:nitrous oxide-stimulated promoter family protein [Desulfobulbus sp.]
MSDFFASRRMRREARTVEAMIRRYCRDHHHTEAALCSECDQLLVYARKRLQNCPFQEGKTSCGQCPVHCYSQEQRTRIREVMRYAGPRMLLSHPFMALMHLIDGLRKPRRRS